MDVATLVGGTSATPASFWALVIVLVFFIFLGYLIANGIQARRTNRAKDQIREDRNRIEESARSKTKDELADDLDKTLAP